MDENWAIFMNISLKNRFESSGELFCFILVNKILVLLCEGPKHQKSMISGFLSPGEPLFMDLNIPKYFKEYKTNLETFLKHTMFVNMGIVFIIFMFLNVYVPFLFYLGISFFINFSEDGNRGMMNIG